MTTSGRGHALIENTVTETRYTPAHRRGRRSYCLWCWLIGRPWKRRRGASTPKVYVLTRYSPKIFAAIVGVILLSVADAILTLLLVRSGAREMNPLMAYFLDHGPLAFFWAKYLLTCIPLLFIMAHNGVKLFGTGVKAKSLIVWIAVPFALVVYWELYLLLCVV